MNTEPAPPLPTMTESQHKAAHRQTVRSGRGWILAIAIIQLIAGFVFFGIAMNGPNPSALTNLIVTMWGLGVIYIGLWIWARSAPFAAALVALVLYLSLLALDAVVSPASLFQGIILKILIIGGLSQAVKSSYALKKVSAA